MNAFSKRRGLKKNLIQLEGMSESLKNKLWNCFYKLIKNGFHLDPGGYHEPRLKQWAHVLVVEKIMCDHFSIKINQIPLNPDEKLELLEGKLSELSWNEAYDFFEYTISHLKGLKKANFIKEVNTSLIYGNSAYRISDGIFIPIVSMEELNEIESASKSKITQVEDHLQKAKEYLSPSKEKPDYRNSIKESVSAIEALVRIIENNDEELSKNLKKAKLNMHPTFKEALSKIYAYACDASGVRHGHKISSSSSPSLEEAKFILVICSAYINLIRNKNTIGNQK